MERSEAAVAADPEIAIAGDNAALVVWSEVIGGHSVVQARNVDSGATVSLSNSGDAALAKVGFDAAGNAIAVWTQFENNRNDIWSSRFVAASGGWSAPLRISAPNAVADGNVPALGVDAAGNAIVVWHQGDGRNNHFDIWSSRFAVAAGSWSAPALLSDGVASAFNPCIAVNAAGIGAVAWSQAQGDGSTSPSWVQDIWARRVDAGGVFGRATRLDGVGGDVDGYYGQIALAVDAFGNGFALWVQGSGSLPFVIHAARLSASQGWQSDVIVNPAAIEESYSPHLGLDAAGNAVAVWQQQTGVGAYGAFARFDAATAIWGAPASFGGDVAGDVYDPHVAVDGAGNATAVWYQLSGDTVSILSSRSLAGGAWSASGVLDVSPVGFSFPVPRVAANAAGRTLALWGLDSE